MGTNAIVTTQWDESTNSDVFKTLIRDIWDSTDREALVEHKELVKVISTKDEFEREMRIAGMGLAEQVKRSNLEIAPGQTGTDEAAGANAIERFNNAVIKAQNEHKIDYTAAVMKVAGEQPDLYAAYQGVK